MQCPAAKAAVIKKHKGEVNNLDHLSTMLCSAGKPRVPTFRWMLLETHHLCWCTSDGNSKGGASRVTSSFVCKYVSFLLLSQTLIVLKFVRVHAEFLLRQMCKEAATEHSKFSSAYDDLEEGERGVNDRSEHNNREARLLTRCSFCSTCEQHDQIAHADK